MRQGGACLRVREGRACRACVVSRVSSLNILFFAFPQKKISSSLLILPNMELKGKPRLFGIYSETSQRPH